MGCDMTGITKTLENMIKFSQGDKVILLKGFTPLASVTEERDTPYSFSHKYRFSLEWKCEVVCNSNELEYKKKDVIKFYKNAVYGGIVSELYNILKCQWNSSYQNRELEDKIYSLIKELQ
jgi:hypothetical protein